MSRLLLLLLSCLAAVSGVTKFPKCDKGVIEKIHAYWSGAGTPDCVLDSKGVYSAYKSTDNPLYKGVKCRNYDFQPGGKIKVTVDGVDKIEKATEKDGVLTLTAKKVFVILAENGVIACYNCSDDEDAPTCNQDDIEDGTILVKKGADPDTVAHAQGVLRMLGFHLNKDYQCQSGDTSVL